MEIRDLGEFLAYFDKIHERTMRVVAAIPPDKVDWRFRDGAFTLGDLVRHIATVNRFMFAEVVQGRPSAYAGCGKEMAADYDEIVALANRLHRETAAIISGFSAGGLQSKCTTPAGASITVWKWLRAMIEHEIHHRGQIYIYLSLLGVPSPPLYGLTSVQLVERSSPR